MPASIPVAFVGLAGSLRAWIEEEILLWRYNVNVYVMGV